MATSVYELELFPQSKTKVVQFKTGKNEQTRLQLLNSGIALFEISGAPVTHDEIYKEYKERWELYRQNKSLTT